MVFYPVRYEKPLPTFLEWERVLAERSNHEEGSREQLSFAIRFISYGSVAPFLRYLIREQLPTGSPSLCKTGLGNGKSDWGGCSAGEKGLESFVRDYWAGKRPDCVPAFPH